MKKQKNTKKNIANEIKSIIIKKGKQTFIVCPKCGWKHSIDEKTCRFCGAKL